MDGHRAQKNHQTKKFSSQVGLTMRVIEQHTRWTIGVQLYICIFKEAVRRDLRLSHPPMVFWDYCMERRALIHNAVPHPLSQNHGLTSHEATFGAQCDISKSVISHGTNGITSEIPIPFQRLNNASDEFLAM